MNNRKEVIEFLISIVLFTALFALSVFLLSMWVFKIAPNFNSLLSVALSFLCALPLSYGLFFNSVFIKKAKLYQKIVLPALIFPLCILLSLGSSLYQQRPEGLFKIFVMDTIPHGVSNIQGYDTSMGFDTEVILAFNATPEALDKIIAKNQLVLVEESNMINDPNYEYLSDIHWNENWTIYEKLYSTTRVELITIWISPDDNTVLFRYVYG